MIARKSTGGVRVCGNLVDVNRAMIAGCYPLPTMDELGRVFNGMQFFSKLDIRGAYLQVSLHPDVRHMMAMITTPLGLLQWPRLPMGLCSAPSCFKKSLTQILKGCQSTVHLIDDIIICNRTRAEHDGCLHEILIRLCKHNVVLFVEKVLFGVSELAITGFHVSGKGVIPMMSNVNAMLIMPEPLNVKKVKSLVASFSSYHMFIQNFNAIAEPLYGLQHKNTEW